LRHAQSLKAIWRHAREVSATSPLWAGLFIARALRDPRSIGAWLLFLGTFERRRGLVPARTETVIKPLGNYAVHRLAISERFAMLRSHYSLVAEKLPATVLSTLWSGSSVELGYLHGKRRQSFRLTLDPADYCYKEGEFSFTLADAADGLELARLTFVLRTLNANGEFALLIGGLQGPSSHCGPGAKARIVAATRSLSGLRPKMAVFTAASAFAKAIGSHNLHAVSNRTHTINADAWYQRRRMRADYDAFWIERGGTPNASGFELPLQVAPRTHCTRRNEQRGQVAALVYRLFEHESAKEPLTPLASSHKETCGSNNGPSFPEFPIAAAVASIR
jgi:uncharacterized protein VirK/YbjX